MGRLDHRVRCPCCNGAMVQRFGKNGRFWGCSNWPSCTGTLGKDADALVNKWERKLQAAMKPKRRAKQGAKR